MRILKVLNLMSSVGVAYGQRIDSVWIANVSTCDQGMSAYDQRTLRMASV